MLKSMFKHPRINQLITKKCIPKKEIRISQIEGIEILPFKNSFKKIRKRYYSLGERLIKDGWYYR